MSAELPPPPDDLNALPPGTRFGELEILRMLGAGGFGIVYLGKDHALERLVAIKEYMPGQLAQRGQNSQVTVRSGSMRETFELGLRSFVNEARLLARFDHRSLLKVYRFWEANSTAYMVMPYLQGQTLKQWRDARGSPPEADWLMKHLLPLLGGLAELHAHQVYHRDIAPDNIFLPADGSDPILLDFGAARRAIGDHTQSFTAILKPSYAPLEQYDGANALKQGPWTDLYALGAVLHHLLAGRPPPAATRRALADDYEPLALQAALAAYPQALLQSIDWALRLRPGERPQSVAQFRAVLQGELTLPPPVHPVDAPVSGFGGLAPGGAPGAALGATVVLPPAQATSAPYSPTIPTTPQGSAAYEATQIVAPPAPAQPPPPPPAAPAPAAPAVAQPLPPSAPPGPPATAAGKPLWLPLGLAAAALLLLAFWWVLKDNAKPDGPNAVSAAASAASAASAMALAPAASAADMPASLPAVPLAAPVTAPGPGAEPSPALAPPRSPRPQSAAPVQSPPNPATRPPDAAALAQAHRAASVPASAVRPGVEPAVQAGAEDPKAACGSRVFIALQMCIDRKCQEPAHAQHPECVKLNEIRNQRERERERGGGN